MNNYSRFKGGNLMNINDTKLIFVISPNDNDKQEDVVKDIINQLIKDDKKNKREDAIYVNALSTFNFLSNIVEKDDLINHYLKLLTKCDEIYVLPNYELDEVCSQCLGIAKILDLPITYL